MKCQVCGAMMETTVTDLPFKLDNQSIVILKDLPVHQCVGCSEYLLEDRVLQRVEEIFGKIDPSAELEIIRYAA